MSSVQRAEGGKDAVTLEAWKADRVHKMLVDPIGPLAAPSRMTESIDSSRSLSKGLDDEAQSGNAAPHTSKRSDLKVPTA